jgi:glucosamine--fructose-6-phosphate aminotransferase (isomerizing)
MRQNGSGPVANPKGCLVAAVRAALKQVIGTYGIALVHREIPDFIVGARRGSPLVLGVGKDENFSQVT